MAEKPDTKNEKSEPKSELYFARGIPKTGFYRCAVHWHPNGSVHEMTPEEVERLKKDPRIADVRKATSDDIAGRTSDDDSVESLAKKLKAEKKAREAAEKKAAELVNEAHKKK